MPRFVCEIGMDNAAFEESPMDELTEILSEQVVLRAEMGDLATGDQIPLIDGNGNTVGFAQIKD